MEGSKLVDKCLEEFVYPLQAELEGLGSLPLNNELGPEGVGDLVHCFQVSIQSLIDGH